MSSKKRISQFQVISRRKQVARLRLQRYTGTDIYNILMEYEKKKHTIENKKKGRIVPFKPPYCKRTIYNDINYLEKQWMAGAARDTEMLKAELIEETRQARAVSWESKDSPKSMANILRSIVIEGKLIGVLGPKKLEVGFAADEVPELVINISKED